MISPELGTGVESREAVGIMSPELVAGFFDRMARSHKSIPKRQDGVETADIVTHQDVVHTHMIGSNWWTSKGVRWYIRQHLPIDTGDDSHKYLLTVVIWDEDSAGKLHLYTSVVEPDDGQESGFARIGHLRADYLMKKRVEEISDGGVLRQMRRAFGAKKYEFFHEAGPVDSNDSMFGISGPEKWLIKRDHYVGAMERGLELVEWLYYGGPAVEPIGIMDDLGKRELIGDGN